jgi:hypothetical protein
MSISHNDNVILEVRRRVKENEDVNLAQILDMMDIGSLNELQKKEMSELFNITVRELVRAIQKTESRKKLFNLLGAAPKNEYDFVDLLLDRWKCVVDFNGIFRIKTDYVDETGQKLCNYYDFDKQDRAGQMFLRNIDPKELTFDTMVKRIYKVSVTELSSGYELKDIHLALDDWQRRQKNGLVATISSLVSYDARAKDSGAEEWDRFVAALTDCNVIETRYVLQHFVWQVKRKMTGLPVTDHMMPVLYGKQGSGKSSAVRQLLEPIRDFAAYTDFKSITDERNHELWANYVLVFDEMGHSTTANIEIIKQKITSDQFNGRVMHSNSTTVIQNKTTSIGTSNRDLSRMIFDDTGMRRFFQIDCRHPIDWAALNAIDYQLLWQSIDETQASNLQMNPQVFKQVQSIQNEKRQVTLIEQFLESFMGSRTYQKIGASELYEEFQQFEKMNQPRNEMSSTKFGRDLPDIARMIPGLTVNKLKTRGGIVYEFVKT